MNRWRAALAAAVLMTLAACSSDTQTAPTPSASRAPKTTATPTPSPTPTESASVIAAKTAYLRFIKASQEAEKRPKTANYKALSAVAVDPALGKLQEVIINFSVNDLAFKGTPPSSRINVVRDSPNATPWPRVDLVDCPTSSNSWRPYSLKTGQPAKTAPAKAPPPYATSVAVIYYEKRWAVYTADANRSATCTP